MTLRDKIEALPAITIPAVSDGKFRRYLVRDDVFAIIDEHSEDCKHRIALLIPAEELSEARKLGYRLGIMDAMGIYEGRITKDSSGQTWSKEHDPQQKNECSLCAAGVLVAHDPRDKEHAKRPARDALLKSDCYSNDARALGLRALVEAIDANTAAIREKS